MQRLFRNIGLTVFALASAAVPSQAQSTQLFSPADLTGSTYTPSYTGASGDTVGTPYTITGGGNTLTFSVATGNNLYREDSDGVSFDFAAGTTLIETVDTNSATPTAPLTIDFDQGVSEFGLSAQDYAYDYETFTYTIFSGSTPLAAYFTGLTDNTGDTGTAVFLGAKATGSQLITSVRISSLSSEIGASNDFLAGPVTYSAAPEPAATVALGIGMMGLGVLAIKRRVRRIS